MDHHKHQLVDYRNALYFGRINKLSRQGNGILITDDSYILLANWSDNLIDGPYIYLFNNNFILGTSHEGKLQKFNLIITPTVRIYANYKNNMIHNKCIIEDEKGIKLFNFDNGKKVGTGVDIPYQKLKDYVWREFGQQILTIPAHLEKFLHRQDVKNITRVRSIRISEHFQYYGTLNEDGDCEGLGFVINIQNNQIYSSGNYKNGTLHGLARTLQTQKLIIDGVFQNGDYKGSGVVYDINLNTYTYHNFQQPVYGDPTKKIREVRKQFHLRSLNYINQMIMIASIIKIRIAEITLENDKMRENIKDESNQNTERQSNYSPYRVPVFKDSRERSRSEYDYQSDYVGVDTSSPIKKINNLAPTKSRKEEGKLEVDREVKSISSMSKKSLMDNHFHKETKELVRDLETETNKRIDLHQIYRQTKMKKARK